MKKMLTIALMLVAASVIGTEYNYGFEDGGLPLGYYSDMTCTIATSPVYSGNFSLMCVDGGLSGTPEAYLVWVQDLVEGDTVTAGFWGYDTTEGSSPSLRIWAHYADDYSDITVYGGSADSNNSDYTDGLGWSYVEHTWTIGAGHQGLCIAVRTYSILDDTGWVDDIYVNAPDGATVILPEGDVATQDGTWGQIKALY